MSKSEWSYKLMMDRKVLRDSKFDCRYLFVFFANQIANQSAMIEIALHLLLNDNGSCFIASDPSKL